MNLGLNANNPAVVRGYFFGLEFWLRLDRGDLLWAARFWLGFCIGRRRCAFAGDLSGRLFLAPSASRPCPAPRFGLRHGAIDEDAGLIAGDVEFLHELGGGVIAAVSGRGVLG